MVEGCVVRYGYKNWHEKNMCMKGIGPRIQNMLIIVRLEVNLIWGTYMTT